MIRLEQVGVTYPRAKGPALRGVDLEIGEGELVLVAA